MLKNVRKFKMPNILIAIDPLLTNEINFNMIRTFISNQV